jgi:hypothetical protein
VQEWSVKAWRRYVSSHSGKKLAEKHGLFVATRDKRRTGHSKQVKAKTGKEKHEKQSYSKREE